MRRIYKEYIECDSKRVLLRPFLPSKERAIGIAKKLENLSLEQCQRLLSEVYADFEHRHRNFNRFIEDQAEELRKLIPLDLHHDVWLLLATYHCQEYAVEAAALFNPSVVKSPDQSNTREGYSRFVLSMRSVGEGHLSSLTFRNLQLSIDGDLFLEPKGRFVTAPYIDADNLSNRNIFEAKVRERNLYNNVSAKILEKLPLNFSYSELQLQIELAQSQSTSLNDEQRDSLAIMSRLAQRHYGIVYSDDIPIEEQIIFPHTPIEARGIEDARFVEFDNGNERPSYIATYTAWDGSRIAPQLIITNNFKKFNVRPLSGAQAKDKGLALFPRKIDGKYAMIGRQDHQNMFIMFSDNLYLWRTRTLLQDCFSPWNYVQLGNCGSPIETERGWLLLIHGVGPVRTYVISALLLDRDNPTKVIGRLAEPIIKAASDRRDGYVPNVVYTCGVVVHAGTLFIPYAESDQRISFISFSLAQILNLMQKAD